ncbi:MAG: GNAT family N-acetyltransferase [Opitutales bacterium]|jgi:GNAT superfamily N-acetyltransferase
MSDVSYRFATSADIEALVRLRLDFLTESGQDVFAIRTLPDDIRAYFLRALSQGEFVAAVAEAAGAIIGLSGIVYDRHPPRVTNPNGILPYLLNVYVVPPRRRQGIATKLIEMLVAHARQAGCTSVSLHVLPGGRGGLYPNLGFKPVDNEMKLEL